MDLILSVQSVSFGMMFGVITTILMNALFAHPFFKSLFNTTLVFLNNTKEVWQPVVNTGLILVNPIAPLVVFALDATVKALVIFGFFTVVAVRKAASYVNMTVVAIQQSGLSVGHALTNAYTNVKDVAVSFGTIMRALGSVTVRLIKMASFVVQSFEHVSDFLYRSIFETRTITWNDMVNVAVPAFVVFSILGYIAWRMSRMMGTKPIVQEEDEEICKPVRRSPRLICKEIPNYKLSSYSMRKRSVMSSSDAPLSS